METKAKMSDLFKNGDNFKFKEVDYSSKKMQKEIDKLKKERIRKSSELPSLVHPFWHTPFNI